jgi:hypothetical protein
VVGTRRAYLCGHDEVHSLAKNMDGADVRFWMGFGDHYINVFTVLKSIGLLSEQPVKLADGSEVVPLKVVKACLPDPASLAPEYEGKTCIGDYVKGLKDGKEKTVFIYNVADHKDAYNEVGSQGISYTAGVPPFAAAMLVATGEWDVKKMANVEELDPKPFINISTTAWACRRPASRTNGPGGNGAPVTNLKPLPKPANIEGPAAHGDRRLEGIPPALGARIDHPAEFVFGKQRSVINADLAQAFAGFPVVDHQRAAAQERPLRQIMAEQPPGLGHRVRAFHVDRPVRHHQARIGRPVLHGLHSQSQPLGLKCGDQEAGLAGVRVFFRNDGIVSASIAWNAMMKACRERQTLHCKAEDALQLIFRIRVSGPVSMKAILDDA